MCAQTSVMHRSHISSGLVELLHICLEENTLFFAHGLWFIPVWSKSGSVTL